MDKKNRKICLISFCNIYLLPYANKYIELAVKNEYCCDLLFVDRDGANGEHDNYDVNTKYVINKRFQSYDGFLKKVVSYFESILFFRKVLKNNKYDKLVFLQTQGAVIFCLFLKKYYKKKYIIEIRDYSFEFLKVYKELEKIAINNSYASVVSSRAFCNFLPQHNYIVAHNYVELKGIKKKELTNKKDVRINITFVGRVRFLDMDKQLIETFKNDERFCLCYYGGGSELLKDYCLSNNIYNVDFYGEFPQEKTSFFYENASIINNLYGNNNPLLDYALSNKLYHSIQLKIPIVVCPNTYMSYIVNKYNLGFTFDINDVKCKEKLYNDYVNFDRKKYTIGCKEYKQVIINDNLIYTNILKKFFIKPF